MKIVAINASPRKGWNTDILVEEAAQGARSQGAEVVKFDLYKLDKFTGCVSCFACKLGANKGKCVYKDGLAPVLEAIRQADGLIIGSPNYLGDITAGARALYERLIFQSLTYMKDKMCCNERPIPVLFIMTSNVSDSFYEKGPYADMLARYRGNLENAVGPTKTFICGDTLQVKDYSRFNWTLFDPEAKRRRHEEVFPQERAQVRKLGEEMVGG